MSTTKRKQRVEKRRKGKRRKERIEEQRREEKKREEKREEKKEEKEERRREENRREEKEEKIDCVKERACTLQTFYHKNMFKNTLNFKINIIVKLYDIFEKNRCLDCLAYIF